MHLLSIASTKFPEWTNDPHLSLCLGACHSLTVRNGRLTGDPDELKVPSTLHGLYFYTSNFSYILVISFF